MYIQVDNIVNVDLYEYGLQVSLGWILDYWSSYKIVLACLLCAPVAMMLGLIPYYIYSREKTNTSKWSIILFSLISVSLLGISMFYIFQIDQTVNTTLYQYGLQLNQEWLTKYWLVTQSTLALTGASIAISFAVALVTWKINGNEA